MSFDIKRFAFDFGLRQKDLGSILNIDQPAVSMMMNGNRHIREEHIDLLRAKYGNCVDAYIVDEDTKRIFNTAQSRRVTATIIPAEVVEEIKTEAKAHSSDCEEEVKETVVIPADVIREPNYDIKKEVLGGTVEGRIKPTQSIIPEHDIKAYTYCDDMAPEIKAGEAVLVRFIPEEVRIIPGNMYLVDLPSCGLIRYVFELPDGKLLLRAANAAYPDLTVHRSEAMSISLVVLILKRPSSASEDLRPMADALERRDRQMDSLITEISKAGERESRLIDMLEKK